MLTKVPNLGRYHLAFRYLQVPWRLWRVDQYESRVAIVLSRNSTCRQYSQQDQKHSSAIAESRQSGGEISTATAFETVKENTKTAWNLGVIVLGVGITGSILWAIFRELLSSNSPNNIYSKALDRCVSDSRIQDVMGEPIKGYGEETRRGRRRHVSHSIYQKNGRNHMLMKFYVQGSRRKGTVILEMKEDDSGTYQYNFLAVQMEDMLGTRVILEDNRSQNNEAGTTLIPSIPSEIEPTNLL